MATIFCSKSGSDANNGSTYVLSKLTIGASITAAGNSGTVIIGSGLYNEKISTGNNITLYMDGIVVLDGTGIANSSPAISLAVTITILPYTSGGVCIIQNHTTSVLISIVNTGSTSTFQNVVLLSNTNATGTYINSQSNTNTVNFYNVLFSGFATPVVTNPSQIANLSFYNCTFYNGTTGITSTTQGSILISNCTTAWSFSTTPTITSININLYYTITNWIKTSTYTSLAQVQAAGYDLLSAVANPNFVDPANNIFYLTSQSTVSPTVGMYPYGLTRGAANDVGGLWHIIPGAGYDNSGWYNPDGNITKNGTTGYLELTGGSSGVVWSPVMDLGMVQSVSQLNLESVQTFPTNMIDSTNADVRPNYQTSEIRGSLSSFAQNDGVIAWTTVKNNLPFAAITGRYIQVRFTLISNGVGA